MPSKKELAMNGGEDDAIRLVTSLSKFAFPPLFSMAGLSFLP